MPSRGEGNDAAARAAVAPAEARVVVVGRGGEAAGLDDRLREREVAAHALVATLLEVHLRELGHARAARAGAGTPATSNHATIWSAVSVFGPITGSPAACSAPMARARSSAALASATRCVDRGLLRLQLRRAGRRARPAAPRGRPAPCAASPGCRRASCGSPRACTAFSWSLRLTRRRRAACGGRRRARCPRRCRRRSCRRRPSSTARRRAGGGDRSSVSRSWASCDALLLERLDLLLVLDDLGLRPSAVLLGGGLELGLGLVRRGLLRRFERRRGPAPPRDRSRSGSPARRGRGARQRPSTPRPRRRRGRARPAPTPAPSRAPSRHPAAPSAESTDPAHPAVHTSHSAPSRHTALGGDGVRGLRWALRAASEGLGARIRGRWRGRRRPWPPGPGCGPGPRARPSWRGPSSRAWATARPALRASGRRGGGEGAAGGGGRGDRRRRRRGRRRRPAPSAAGRQFVRSASQTMPSAAASRITMARTASSAEHERAHRQHRGGGEVEDRCRRRPIQGHAPSAPSLQQRQQQQHAPHADEHRGVLARARALHEEQTAEEHLDELVRPRTGPGPPGPDRAAPAIRSSLRARRAPAGSLRGAMDPAWARHLPDGVEPDVGRPPRPPQPPGGVGASVVGGARPPADPRRRRRGTPRASSTSGRGSVAGATARARGSRPATAS